MIKEIKLINYEWITDEAALLNACLRDNSLVNLLNKCNSLNIIGFTSMDNGMDGENCMGYVEFTFEPEVEMLHKLGQPV